MNDHIDLLYLLSSESCRDRHDYHVSSRSHHIVWCYILLSQWRDDEACNINGKIRVVISRRAYEKSCSLFSILHLSIFLVKSNQIYLWRKNTNTNERKWNKLKATDVLPNTKARRPPKGPKMPFLSPVTLTFNLWPWPSNTSSVWIWHKSVQRFSKYFIHKQKNTTDGLTPGPSSSTLILELGRALSYLLFFLHYT